MGVYFVVKTGETYEICQDPTQQGISCGGTTIRHTLSDANQDKQPDQIKILINSQEHSHALPTDGTDLFISIDPNLSDTTTIDQTAVNQLIARSQPREVRFFAGAGAYLTYLQNLPPFAPNQTPINISNPTLPTVDCSQYTTVDEIRNCLAQPPQEIPPKDQPSASLNEASLPELAPIPISIGALFDLDGAAIHRLGPTLSASLLLKQDGGDLIGFSISPGVQYQLVILDWLKYSLALSIGGGQLEGEGLFQASFNPITIALCPIEEVCFDVSPARLNVSADPDNYGVALQAGAGLTFNLGSTPTSQAPSLEQLRAETLLSLNDETQDYGRLIEQFENSVIQKLIDLEGTKLTIENINQLNDDGKNLIARIHQSENRVAAFQQQLNQDPAPSKVDELENRLAGNVSATTKRLAKIPVPAVVSSPPPALPAEPVAAASPPPAPPPPDISQAMASLTQRLIKRDGELRGILFPVVHRPPAPTNLTVIRKLTGKPQLLSGTPFGKTRKHGDLKLGENAISFWTHLSDPKYIRPNELSAKMQALSRNLKQYIPDAKEIIFIVHNVSDENDTEADLQRMSKKDVEKLKKAWRSTAEGIHAQFVPVSKKGLETIKETNLTGNTQHGSGIRRAVQIIVVRGDGSHILANDIIAKAQ
ncbi:MAG: hypothetical protein HYU97_12355 [Deltaproteobacteria bacterium]|nr:hypothetical protein [Deltaproteobacteria bacterium]